MDGKFGSSKHSDLKLVLSAIRRAIPELHGVMIASQDGLAIAHDFPEADAERIAARAGEDAVLVMQGPIESNLGLMRIEARVAAVEIKQLLTRA